MSEAMGEHMPPAGDVWFTWNSVKTEEPSPASAYSGIFFDETLRDGLQAPHIRELTLEQKLQFVDHMVRSGVRSADLGFPSSDVAAARECTEIAKYIAANRLDLVPGYAGRTHPADINAICEVGQRAGVAVEAYAFIGVSPIRQYVEDWDIEVIKRAIRTSAAECERGNVTFVLVLEDAVRCTAEVLRSVYDTAMETGTGRLTLCDTVGAAVPSGTEALIRWTQRYFADRGHPVELEWHGHNDRGLALVNSLTALALGCARVHGTILGIGERAGNASLDQLMVNSHLDGHRAYDLKALSEYCRYAAPLLGVDIPQNYPAMGRDVFKTSAGVHASAILKAHEKGSTTIKDGVYAGVPAGLLGREQEVLIDAASGESNVKYWLTLHGHATDDASLIKRVLERAKSNGAPLTDEEIGLVLATGR
ncbi:LeuA family protein [Streptomyces sp. NPDC048297]|uniref:LeuA family protein n=1 Tax=Streptomyces sp. NPDC048297 TaxID=3365531 RepID=UPI003712EE42